MYVTEVTGKSVRPHDIGEAATRCLRDSSYQALRRVLCESDNGVLLLRGCLSSFYLKQIAQEAVARVNGVTQVVNDIEVG
jgi:osmotically-inducible protein OsmY